MPPEWEQGPYGAPSHRVSSPRTSAQRQQPLAPQGSPPRRQRPYADAPLGTTSNPTRPRRSPYDEPNPQALPRRREPGQSGQPRRPRPDRNGGNGNRNGNGSGNGGGGGRGGGRGPGGPRGRGPGGPKRPETQVPKVKRRRSWKQRLILTALASVVLFTTVGAGAGVWLMNKLGQVKVISDITVDEVAAGEPANYLIVGSDTRAGDGNSDFGGGSGSTRRADTMMVVRLDPETKAASVISFPRDLIVPIASTGSPDRLNAAYNESNQVLIDTLKQNFGIEINRYIVIDFIGFQKLVDAVGGVPIYFERPVKDTNTGLDQPAGCVVLDGHQGLAYARSRKLQYLQDNGKWSREDKFADLGRIERQRVFIELALGKALGDVKSNPVSLVQMVNIGIENVEVDPVTGEDPLGLAKQFKDFDLANLTTYSLPVLDNPNGDGATVVVKEDEADPILNIFRGLEPGEVAPGRITVNVYNGTAVDGQALNAASALQTRGFKIGETTDEAAHERTTIAARGDEQNLATQVARYVTGGADIVVDDSLDEGEVKLITGANFATIHEEPTPLDQMPGATTIPPDASGGTTVPPTDTPVPPPALPEETSLESEYTLGAPCPA